MDKKSSNIYHVWESVSWLLQYVGKTAMPLLRKLESPKYLAREKWGALNIYLVWDYVSWALHIIGAAANVVAFFLYVLQRLSWKKTEQGSEVSQKVSMMMMVSQRLGKRFLWPLI